MAGVAVQNLSLRFDGLAVLDGISFEVAPGELMALIGPNGASKTSVLNCISGIYRGHGSIRLAGAEIHGEAPHVIARRGVARTFQHGELFAEMSVLDNMLTGRHARIATTPMAELLFMPSVRRAEITHREAVERIITLTELERYRHAPVGSLPFGVQKIAGFARALSLEPRVVLLDEPSAGLNRQEREGLPRVILRTQQEMNMTRIWIEHDMQMVADLADRIHVLDYGRTIADGPPDIVLNDPEVMKAYIGTVA